MITIFGKTVYKILLVFRGGSRLVSPVYSFEYELRRLYKNSYGFYSYPDLETAKSRLKGISGIQASIFKCRIPWFSKYEILENGDIKSEKIKIKERV